MIESIEKRDGTTAMFWQKEESEGTVVDKEVFEAEALGWYLKT